MPKKRVLITSLIIQDLGGIAGDITETIRGFKDLGWDYEFVQFAFLGTQRYVRKQTTVANKGVHPWEIVLDKYPDAQISSMNGIWGVPVFPIASDELLEEWKEYANSFDLVIHEIPGPNPNMPRPSSTPQEIENGHKYWKEIYKLDTKQIMIHHDAHFRELCPHMIYLHKNLDGIACVNQAGYRSLSWHPVPRAFIPPPLNIYPDEDFEQLLSWGDRKNFAIAAHVWKPWKRNDLIARAIPHMRRTKFWMAGDGIEAKYMRSPTKCPPEYAGQWQRFIESPNAKWLTQIPNPKVFEYYKKSRIMVDMSFSQKYAGLVDDDGVNYGGAHWNRSFVESANFGCVPLVVAENMREEGFSKRMWKEGVTHFEIGAAANCVELAEKIDWCVNDVHPDDATQMVLAVRKRIKKWFNHVWAVEQMIKLADGEACGVYGELEKGTVNEQIKTNAKLYLSGKKNIQPILHKNYKKIRTDKNPYLDELPE